MEWRKYFDGLLEKELVATGRLMNFLEGDYDPGEKVEFLRACAAQKRKSYVLGITGVPGAGKSTLIDGLGTWLAGRGLSIGVIAIDPSSPFRGGAILGDRVRFKNLSARPGCFIRSMATRGHLGGLGTTTREAIQLLEAAGFDLVIIETVGTGQTEVEIVSVADTVVLVTVPGLGDQMQVIKAGIMEIGDIFVVNKADRPGADETVQRIRGEMGSGAKRGDGWLPPVVPTVSTQQEGVEVLGGWIEAHRRHLEENGELRAQRARRNVDWCARLLAEKFSASLASLLKESEEGRRLRREVEVGEIDIYEASTRIWNQVMHSA